jgi:hypothetical protein
LYTDATKIKKTLVKLLQGNTMDAKQFGKLMKKVLRIFHKGDSLGLEIRIYLEDLMNGKHIKKSTMKVKNLQEVGAFSFL